MNSPTIARPSRNIPLGPEPIDRALIATGGRPRLLNVPAGLDRVLCLRPLGDATQLSGALASSNRVVIVGAGLIGLEVASAARTLGKEVTVP